MGVTINEAQPVVLPPMSDTPTTHKKALLMEVRVNTAAEGGAVVSSILVDTDAFVRAHVEKLVKDNASERLEPLLAAMLDRQAALLIATQSIAENI